MARSSLSSLHSCSGSSPLRNAAAGTGRRWEAALSRTSRPRAAHRGRPGVSPEPSCTCRREPRSSSETFPRLHRPIGTFDFAPKLAFELGGRILVEFDLGSFVILLREGEFKPGEKGPARELSNYHATIINKSMKAH